MMDSSTEINDYRIATTEVLCILEYLPNDIKENIPTNFLNFLNAQSLTDYKAKFDYSQGLDKIELRSKTKALLAMIYRNYICTEKERAEYDEILEKNEKAYQNELKAKYNSDNLFKKERNENNYTSEEVQLVEYKESFFTKIIYMIKKLFHRE